MSGTPAGETSTPPTTERSAAPRTKTYSKFELPSERFPFSAHLETVKRFIVHTGSGRTPVPARQVEGNGLSTQAAVLNAGFLTDAGLLDEKTRGMYVPTEEAVAFINTRTADPERARPILRKLLERKWFAEATETLLQTQPSVTEDDLAKNLAMVAVTDYGKKERAMRVLIDYLLESAIIVRTEQGLALGNSSAIAPSLAAAAPAAPPLAPFTAAPAASPPSAPDSTSWEVVQTNDFYVKVKASKTATARLRRHLDLLDEKFAEDGKIGTP